MLTTMTYEEMKDRARRRAVELILIFEEMEAERAAEASLIKTGQMATGSDDLRKSYTLAQMTICGMSAKLLTAVKEMLY